MPFRVAIMEHTGKPGMLITVKYNLNGRVTLIHFAKLGKLHNVNMTMPHFKEVIQ